MRYGIIPTARRLIPAAGLLLATMLGGCVAYTGHPPDRYGYNNRCYYNDPAGYAYTTPYNDPAYYANDTSHYPPVHFGPFNPHADGGGG